MITLYSTNCPKCKVVELKLNQKNINYNIENNLDTILELGKKIGIMSAPILQIDDKYFDFSSAIKEINNL